MKKKKNFIKIKEKDTDKPVEHQVWASWYLSNFIHDSAPLIKAFKWSGLHFRENTQSRKADRWLPN